MITGKQVIVYDWFEIQDDLCRIMEIPTNKFRDYHDVVGGDYKDFWHVCLDTIVPDTMSNGSIVTMFHCGEADDWFEGDDVWKNKVLQAWNVFYNSVDTGQTDSGICVDFSW